MNIATVNEWNLELSTQQLRRQQAKFTLHISSMLSQTSKFNGTSLQDQKWYYFLVALYSDLDWYTGIPPANGFLQMINFDSNSFL